MDYFILIELIMTVFVYLVFPVVYVKNNGRQELGVAKKIALWNSVVCAGIFMLVRLAVSGGELVGVSIPVAVFYYFINKGILREREDSIEGKLKNQKAEILQQQKDPYFTKRYNLEYQLIRNIAFLMDEEMEKIFFDKQSLLQFLFERYAEIDSNVDRKEFDVVYPNKNIVIMRLPKTTLCGLCNMIGIIKNEKGNRFFAFTTHATEWMQNGQRQHYEFDVEELDDFSKFVLDACGENADNAEENSTKDNAQNEDENKNQKEGENDMNNNENIELEVVEIKKTGYGFEKENPIMIIGANNVSKVIENLRVDRDDILMSFPQIRAIRSMEVEGIFGTVDEVEVDFVIRTKSGKLFVENYHIFICGYKPAESKADMLIKVADIYLQEFEIPEGFSYFKPNPKALRNLDEI